MATLGPLGRLQVAVVAFIEALRNPKPGSAQNSLGTYITLYKYLDAWDKGTVLTTQIGGDDNYKAALETAYKLYRYARLLWNPTPGIFNAHAEFIYPGTLSTDGLPFANGKQTAVPFTDDTTPNFAMCAAQIMTWSSWQNRKSLWPRYGAKAGATLMVINDPSDARKIYLDPKRPDQLAGLTLNEAGDVLDCSTEYKVTPTDGSKPYVYRKAWTRTQILTYMDDKPHSYEGVPAVLDHPYPFCPAVWVKHQEGEGIWGTGAIDSVTATLGALAQINGLESQIDDAMSKAQEEITVFYTDKPVSFLGGAKRGETSNVDPDQTGRESKRVWVAPANAKVEQLGSLMKIDEARAYLDMKRTTFLADYPEKTVWDQIRLMDYAAIGAIELLHGDFTSMVKTIRANYDRQLLKALQMAITMGAIQAQYIWPKSGPMDAARQKFRAFDEFSYERGEMNAEIADRPLFPMPALTDKEKHEIADQQINKLGLPEEYVWATTLSIPADEIKKMLAAKKQAEEEAATKALATQKATMETRAQVFGVGNQQAQGGAQGQPVDVKSA